VQFSIGYLRESYDESTRMEKTPPLNLMEMSNRRGKSLLCGRTEMALLVVKRATRVEGEVKEGKSGP
jgi:hypothetical protein